LSKCPQHILSVLPKLDDCSAYLLFTSRTLILSQTSSTTTKYITASHDSHEGTTPLRVKFRPVMPSGRRKRKATEMYHLISCVNKYGS
jgi:hypothetical protein